MSDESRIICPNCGDDKNTEKDEFCSVCYHPFKKMNEQGEVRSNYDGMVIKNKSRIWDIATWCVLAAVGITVYRGLANYYKAEGSNIESKTLSNIMRHKNLIMKMEMLVNDMESSEFTDDMFDQYKEAPEKEGSENDTTFSQAVTREVTDVEEPPQIAEKFDKTETPNFIIYSNNSDLRLSLSQSAERIFNGIITELGFFSAWTNQKKMKIYVFSSASSYHENSKLPIWSGGYASGKQMAVYLYESDSFNLVFPHELAHLIYSIFMEGKVDLSKLTWINEGIAVYVEMRNNPDTYGGIDRHMSGLARSGRLLRMEDVVSKNIYGATDKEIVKQWYLQVGSMVSFLVKDKGSMSFYNFCNGLKIFEGDVEKSLNYAFSGEFNTIKELEKAWHTYLIKGGTGY